ncbi:MAG: Gfo/Idh/MocA family oxidoreductase [Armatimonadetes bacterium]|nr:Gfo/Idh/MocA family oxidoreductase [Armatimonadota bacterium]
MKKVGIIGGETHIGEVTNLRGGALEVVGAAVREDQTKWATEAFGVPVVTDYRELLVREDVDLVAVANENDLRGKVVLDALLAGKDVVVDKPLAITDDEQDAIEKLLADHAERRLLMLLTLRGNSLYAGLRQVVRRGQIGTPAFTHVRMAVQLKRESRPPWFLDWHRSGGLFLDLLIHGLDQVEWATGKRIVALTANMGNLGEPGEANLHDHAAVYCELEDGSAAVVEGQRMLPPTKGSDYRMTVAGTKGCADLSLAEGKLRVTDPDGEDRPLESLPEAVSVVADWLEGGELVPQSASLRANRLALVATESAITHKRVEGLE